MMLTKQCCSSQKKSKNNYKMERLTEKTEALPVKKKKILQEILNMESKNKALNENFKKTKEGKMVFWA